MHFAVLTTLFVFLSTVCASPVPINVRHDLPEAGLTLSKRDKDTTPFMRAGTTSSHSDGDRLRDIWKRHSSEVKNGQLEWKDGTMITKEKIPDQYRHKKREEVLQDLWKENVRQRALIVDCDPDQDNGELYTSHWANLRNAWEHIKARKDFDITQRETPGLAVIFPYPIPQTNAPVWIGGVNGQDIPMTVKGISDYFHQNFVTYKFEADDIDVAKRLVYVAYG